MALVPYLEPPPFYHVPLSEVIKVHSDPTSDSESDDYSTDSSFGPYNSDFDD